MNAKKENREMNMDEQDGQDGTPNIEQGMSKSEVKQLKTADCQLRKNLRSSANSADKKEVLSVLSIHV